jgi:hypothetical protein
MDCITIYKLVSEEEMGENYNLSFNQNIFTSVKIITLGNVAIM